jgi:acyl-CoA synthetase (AMP-forming)/AMP-acid ligase II
VASRTATLFVAGGAEPREPTVGAFDATALEMGAAADASDDDASTRRLVGCGESQPSQSLFVVEPETATPCTVGQIGEIWVTGPSVAVGYWNRPEETAKTFGARLNGVDAGPFLRTGDLGFMRSGELFITGRLKDLIILRGRTLYPHDVERTVERSHPALRPGCGAAFSVEVDGMERLVVAAEVRREARNSMDTYSPVGHIRAAVASECAVDVSAVVLLRPNTLPKTSSGKTQRAKVRQGFIDGTLEVLTEWRDEAVFGGGGEAVPVTQGWESGRVENWPAKRIAAYTKLTPEHVNRNRALHYYGVDSVIALALVCEMEETFGLFEDEPTVP